MAPDAETPARPLRSCRLRANPRYSLVGVASLGAVELEAVRRLGLEDDAYALLRPDVGSDLTLKTVEPDTAELFARLRRPAVLDETGEMHAGVDDALGRLVLDDVLQIEHDGRFVGGPLAGELICEPLAPADCAGGTGRLSQEALRYGEALQLTDPLALSVRLYCYNRHPLSRAWRLRLTSPRAVRDHLGLDRGRVAAMLRDAWIECPADPSNDGWFHWRPMVSPDASPARWKLYVSPVPGQLHEALGACVSVWADSGAAAFKVGKDVAGILRPDKLIAYFRERSELEAAAARLIPALRGIESQGVPFSASLDRDGLLSFGFDPPVAAGVRGWAGKESWRLWITNRLAAALVAAARTGRDGCEYACARLELDGIDTARWLPSARTGAWEG